MRGVDCMKISTRKTMALGFSGAYILFVGLGIFTSNPVPSEFVAIVSTVVGYYFGRSTALDVPKGGNAHE